MGFRCFYCKTYRIWVGLFLLRSIFFYSGVASNLWTPIYIGDPEGSKSPHFEAIWWPHLQFETWPKATVMMWWHFFSILPGLVFSQKTLPKYEVSAEIPCGQFSQLECISRFLANRINVNKPSNRLSQISPRCSKHCSLIPPWSSKLHPNRSPARWSQGSRGEIVLGCRNQTSFSYGRVWTLWWSHGHRIRMYGILMVCHLPSIYLSFVTIYTIHTNPMGWQ